MRYEAYTNRNGAREKFIESLREDHRDNIEHIRGDVLDSLHVLRYGDLTDEQIGLFRDGYGEAPPDIEGYAIPIHQGGMSDVDLSLYIWGRDELRGRLYGSGSLHYEDGALGSGLPIYFVDNPLDMMAVMSTGKAEAVMILTSERDRLDFFMENLKGETDGKAPPVIIRLESSKDHIGKETAISEAFEKVFGYAPKVSTTGREISEKVRRMREEAEDYLMKATTKLQLASKGKDMGEPVEVLERKAEDLRTVIEIYDTEAVSSIYGLLKSKAIRFQAIEEEISEATDEHREKLEEVRRRAYRYLSTATGPTMGKLLESLRKSARGYIPTGFSNLDRKLGGGWEEGNLYVIGAESSVGKTSLLLQIGDNLARYGGADVLFFSLEMSKEELMAKSLSRLSFERIVRERAPGTLDGWLDTGKATGFYDERLGEWSFYIENNQDMSKEDLVATWVTRGKSMEEREGMEKSISSWRLPKSYSNILRHAPDWDEETFAYMSECAEMYGKEVPTMYVIEDSETIDPNEKGRPTFETITKAIQQHRMRAEAEGGQNRPLVVCIDYLQLLKTESPVTGREMSDKQAMDEAMAMLRNIASEHGAVVIALSSLNRTSYNRPVHIEGLKESGGVEYGADKIIGMEPAGLREPLGGTNDRTIPDNIGRMRAFKETMGARTIKLNILKNRGGGLGHTYLSNVGMFGFFADTDEKAVEERLEERLEEQRKAREEAGKNARKGKN